MLPGHHCEEICDAGGADVRVIEVSTVRANKQIQSKVFKEILGVCGCNNLIY